MGFFKEVYKVVKTIPPGKVMTYGAVAAKIKTRDARKVGWALHANKNPDVPCHRVVDKEGKVAANFAFGGARGQRKKLLKEGVAFVDENHVDLAKHLWRA